MSYHLRKGQYVLTEFRIPRNEDTTNRLDESGLPVLAYNSAYSLYRIHVRHNDLSEHRPLLLDLIRESYTAYMT